MTQPLPLESLSPLPPLVRIGEVLGKYRLDRVLAVGGMGVVVSATHLQLDQRVAIKFMSPLLAGNEGGIQRFMLEARSVARIRSEHVARVFDVDMLPSGTPYIVMEHLDGEDLSAMLERRGWLTVPEAVDYVLQACEAIAEAHAMGIVHRDLKPANLFCCKRPDGAPLVKVLDFGVSKLLPRADPALRGIAATGPHVVLGTPLYASPEQLRASAAVDARTDIWALGVILYELIAGTPPFRADTFLHICAKVAHMPLQSLRQLRPEATEELCAVIVRCLAKEPGNRFPTVAHLAEALAPHAPRSALLSVERAERILRGQAGVRGDEPTLLSATRTPEAPVLAAAATIPGRTRFHRHSALVWAAAGVLAVVSIFACVVLVRSTTPGASAPQPVPRSLPVAHATASAPAHAGSAEDEPRPETAGVTAPQAPPAEPSGSPAPAVSVVPPQARRPAAPRPAPGTSEFGGLR